MEEKSNMRKNKFLKALNLGLLIAVLVGVAVFSTWQPALAIAPTAEEWCELSSYQGNWGGATPNEIGGVCSKLTATPSCASGQQLETATYKGGGGHSSNFDFAVSCVPDDGLNYGMERKGLCKLVEIEDGHLGGTITATIKGRPSVLKLKADGKTYSLPLVPGSVVANGDGTYTAQFYTLDPETGQALVPAGDYSVRCHGGSGSNDGGSSNTVSIGY